MSRHDLYKRLEPGPISAVCVSGLVVSIAAVCIFLGYILPRWKQHRKDSRPMSKYDDSTILTRRIKHYPSHPAIRPLLSKPSAAQILPTYNPRTESPFPDSPNFVKGFAHGPGRVNSAPQMLSSISSNGLFTPTRNNSNSQSIMSSQYHTVPRAVKSKLIAGDSDEFGDAKDFILAVPEPLAFKSRSSGRPPAVTRQLERHGTINTASPATSDKHLHPKKLFEALGRSNYRSSLCSSTSLKVDHRISDAAMAAREMDEALKEAIIQESDRNCNTGYSTEESKPNSSAGQISDPVSDHTTLHRLRSYRSLTGSKSPKLVRSGTLTRSRTPVTELSKVYDPEPEQQTVDSMSQPGQTHPAKGTMANDGFTTEVPSTDLSLTSSVSSSPSIVPFGAILQPEYKRKFSEPVTSRRALFVNQEQLRIRVRASSMYSRDTHGYSLNTTPLTPDFPSSVNGGMGEDYVNQKLAAGRESVKDRVNQFNQLTGQENIPLIRLSPALPLAKIEVGPPQHSSECREDSGQELTIGQGPGNAPGGATWI